MREIHVEESPAPLDEAAKLAEELAAYEEKLRLSATFAEWLGEQSETVQKLVEENAEIGRAKRFANTFVNVTCETKKGRTVWTCHAANGFHQSTTSAEHAVFLLVDSHRTRVEDTEEFRERLQAANGMSKKEALRACARLTNEMRAADPRATGKERDALATVWLENLEAEMAKPQRKVTDR